MTPEQCAYIAGLIDGEGTITTGVTKRNNTRYIYANIIILYSTSFEFTNKVKQIIPYNTSIVGINRNYGIDYSLKMLMKQYNVLPFINEITPYIILKKSQIKLCINIILNIDKEQSRLKLMELNKRGK